MSKKINSKINELIQSKVKKFFYFISKYKNLS